MEVLKLKPPLFVQKLLRTFERSGHQIYIVGGAVRDTLLKEPIKDWDFTTDAEPEIIQGLFPENFYDNRFGTVGITDPDEKVKKGKKPSVYEVTTFRQESCYSNRRHPDKISWGESIEGDLQRRDFTINAIALKPKSIGKENWSLEVIDPHQGQEDIKGKLVRTVGKADQRFQEDALRMMRAIRIATQLRFTLEEKTLQAIQKNVDLIEKVSAERIRDELLKLLSYQYAADGYRLLRVSSLGAKILPEVEAGFQVGQKSPKRHHLYDVGTHSVEALKHSQSRDPIVNLAILLHDVGKPPTVRKTKEGVITFYNHEVVGAAIARRISQRLRLSKKQRERLFKLVRWHQFSVDERQTDKAIRRFIRNVGQENLADILTVRRADRLGGGARETSWRLERFKKKLIEVQKQPFSTKDLKINGRQLMKALSIGPGPLVGKILNALFEEVEEDKNKNKKELLLKRAKGIHKELIQEIEKRMQKKHSKASR